MSDGEHPGGIPSDRVVAVMARIDAEHVQIGSGYLVTNSLVLTARHCTRDSRTERPAESLWVARRTDGSEAPAVVLAAASDIAVLRLAGDPAFVLPTASEPPQFGRVDRTRSRELRDCEAMGFPLWQLDPHDLQRNAAELHGTIRATEDVESGLMVMRDPLLFDVTIPTTANAGDTTTGSPWGGLSGSLVFCKGLAIGVVVQHHPRQGGSAIRILPVEQFSAPPGDSGPHDIATLARALGLPSADKLPLFSDEHIQAEGWRFEGSPLMGYLKAARAAAQQHPYAIALPGAPQLGTVYLRQHVSPVATRAQNRQVVTARDIQIPDYQSDPPVVRRRVALTEVTQLVQRLDPWEVVRQHPGVLITGGPGTGKSSLLRHVVDTLASMWLEGESESFMPVLIRADALTNDMSLPEAISQAVTHELGALLDASILSALFAAQPMPNIPWLILIDGIDEILDTTARIKVFNAIAHWFNDPRYRFVLTSRMLPVDEFRRLVELGVHHFEMQPLTEAESILLARQWFTALETSETPELVDRFMTQLLRSRLGQLVKIPLIVTAICVALTDDPSLEIPLSRADLYERFVRPLIRKPFDQFNARERLQNRLRSYGDEPRHALDKVLDDFRPLTEFLADRRMCRAPGLLIDYAEKFPSCGCPSQLDDSTWRGLLTEMLRQNGCLLQEGKDFSFIHQTVMEYLAACNIQYGPRLRRLHKLELAIRAGRDDSYALFAVSVLRRKGVDLTRPVPRLLGVRRLIHARLVAALVSEGVVLRPKTVQVATRRLMKAAKHSPVSLRGGVTDIWNGEDQRVAAAKSLVLLDGEKGYPALAQAAIAPDIGDFNVFDLLTQQAMRSPATDADRDQQISALMDLASRPAQDEFGRVLIAKLILELDPDRGIPVMEAIARDPTLDSIYRMDCIFQLLEANQERGIEALIAFSADPVTGLFLRFRAVRRLWEISPADSYHALERMAFDSKNSVFVRRVATMRMYDESPSVGKQAVFALSADEKVPGFHRVIVSSLLDRSDSAEHLAKLSAEPSLTAEWRLFAAQRLAMDDMERGIAVMRDIARTSKANLWLRVRATANVWIYRLMDRMDKRGGDFG
jgi:hypothetical protein